MREALGAEIDRLRGRDRGVAWVTPANLHITLKFLGNIPPAGVERIASALGGAVATSPAFDLALRGLGAFPSLIRPRVIWAGVGVGASSLAALANQAEGALVALGFSPETRAFSAHVTLGRVRLPQRDPELASALEAAARRDFGMFRVEGVALMRSELSAGGARYSVVGSWALPS